MTPSPVRLAKWLGLAYAAALTAFFLMGVDSPDGLLFSFFFLPFHLAAPLAAAILVRGSRTLAGAWAFLLLEAALIASMPAATAYSVFMHDQQHWTVAGAAIFLAYVLPFYQYVAVALFAAFAFAFGWRSRPGFFAIP